MSLRHCTVCSVWIALMIGSGCASRSAATAPVAPGVLLRADEVYAPGRAVREFNGGRGGRETQRRVTGEPDESGAWELQILSGMSGELKPVRSLILARGEDGGVLLLRLRDEAEGTVMVFTPPLALLPPKLESGGVFEGRANAEVVRIRDRTIADRGTALSHAEIVADESGTPGRIAWKSRLVFTLSVASITREMVQSVEPGAGVIAEQNSLRVKAGPFTVRSADETWTVIRGDQ
ncbi:MAG: hypothetical protein JNK25_09470 [Phycisphaerae bacterium]|nr:hypothetical protein [Phycisphaerae bacterium]